MNGETLIGVKHEDAVGLFRRTKGKVVLEVEKDAEKKLQEVLIEFFAFLDFLNF